MLNLFISIIGILLTIFFVVGTHESAHFFVARWLKVKVLRFSIGFGKVLWRWHDKKGTEYVLALIPLGGYVKMLDETEGKVPEKEKPFAFNRQPFYKKFLIVLAGPLVNILCALVLYWMIFVIGFVSVKPVIGAINPRSIAAEAGLKANQEILSIDQRTTSTWTSILFRLIIHVGNQDHINIGVKNIGNNQIENHILDVSNWHIDNLNPDPLASLGITPYEPNIPLIIGIMEPNSPAQMAGLKIGDKIIFIDKKPVKNWEELITLIQNHPHEHMIFSIERQGKLIDVPVTIGAKRHLLFQASGFLGIAPTFEWPKNLLHKIQYGPLDAITHAWKTIVDFTYFNLILFGKMFTGKLSLQSLGGPITIFETAGTALNYGFLSFLSFLAFLSISIGIINLLPIPGLDGGHLFIQIIEFIFRRKIPERVLELLFRLGLIFILLILVQAITNDILRMY